MAGAGNGETRELCWLCWPLWPCSVRGARGSSGDAGAGLDLIIFSDRPALSTACSGSTVAFGTAQDRLGCGSLSLWECELHVPATGGRPPGRRLVESV